MGSVRRHEFQSVRDRRSGIEKAEIGNRESSNFSWSRISKRPGAGSTPFPDRQGDGTGHDRTQTRAIFFAMGPHGNDHTKRERGIDTMAFGDGVARNRVLSGRVARSIGLASGIAIAVAGIGGRKDVVAAEPGWSPVVIATGEYRESIRSMPIETRPYRPLHFYGNTRRRIHYRGTPFPWVGVGSDSGRTAAGGGIISRDRYQPSSGRRISQPATLWSPSAGAAGGPNR